MPSRSGQVSGSPLGYVPLVLPGRIPAVPAKVDEKANVEQPPKEAKTPVAERPRAKVPTWQMTPMTPITPMTASRQLKLLKLGAKWTAVDDYFATMFSPALELASDKESRQKPDQLHILRQLDDIICAFDDYINHGDENFTDWRKAHQEAMDDRLVPTPQYPRLWSKDQDPEELELVGDHDWEDWKWNFHYFHLVKEKKIRVSERIKAIVPWGPIRLKGQAGLFLGSSIPKPPERIACVHKKKKIAEVPRLWNMPIDQRIAELAQSSGHDAEEMKKKFWDPAYAPNDNVPALEPYSGEPVSEEEYKQVEQRLVQGIAALDLGPEE